MKVKLLIVLLLVVIATLLPSLVLADDTSGGGRCVIIQGPSVSPGHVIGPVITIGGVHDVQIIGPRILRDTEAGGVIVILPAVQTPPDPC